MARKWGFENYWARQRRLWYYEICCTDPLPTKTSQELKIPPDENSSQNSSQKSKGLTKCWVPNLPVNGWQIRQLGALRKLFLRRKTGRVSSALFEQFPTVLVESNRIQIRSQYQVRYDAIDRSSPPPLRIRVQVNDVSGFYQDSLIRFASGRNQVD